jgi:hypothetical protein
LSSTQIQMTMFQAQFFRRQRKWNTDINK